MTFEEFKKFLVDKNVELVYAYPASNMMLCIYKINEKKILSSLVHVSRSIDILYETNHDYITKVYFDSLQANGEFEETFSKLSTILTSDYPNLDEYEICEVESSKKEDNSAGPIITGTIKIPSIREETLDAAKKCVMGDREQDYGTPESNFATIASFWSDYLDMDISAQQVADMMILMKISRIKNGGGTGDSYVDIAGYAACGNEILNKAHK